MAISTEDRARSTADLISMGALIVAGAGVAAIVLTVIGLAHVAIFTMLSIATIVIGVAFILQGLEVMAEFSAATDGSMSASGGLTLEMLVGGAGIVLGILSLVAVTTMYLVPAAVIVFGGALLLTGFSSAQAPTSTTMGTGEQVLEMARQSKLAAAGAQVIVGIAAIILGILAYVLPTVGPTLALVGLLVVGASLLLASAAEASLAQFILTPARGRAGHTTFTAPGE